MPLFAWFPKGSASCSLVASMALATAILHPQGACALVVSVPGFGDYDITTEDTNYLADPARFESQPWWSSQDNARTFGEAWLSATPQGLADFAYLVAGGRTSYIQCLKGDISCTSVTASTDANRNFAFATRIPTPTPGPLPLLGAAAAFGYSRRLRQRLKAGSASLPSHPAA